MPSARRAYSTWSSSTAGGASVRAASAMALGALPTAARASFGIGAGSRELRGCGDLIERQHACAQRMVECGQAPERAGGAGDLHRAAVIAARDLSEPLRARRAARRLPITIVVGLTHDLRDPLRKPRLLLEDRHQLAPTSLATTLTRRVNSPIRISEHTFGSYPALRRPSVPNSCRKVVPCWKEPGVSWSISRIMPR